MRWRATQFLKPFCVPFIESYFRNRDRVGLLKLSISGKSTVKEIINPDSVNTDKVVIFAAYPSGKIADMHIRFLERLKSIGYSVILVSNHRNPLSVFDKCFEKNWTFIFRRPYGRDFGAYKDATIYLHNLSDKNRLRFKKIIYINDSIATIEKDELSIIYHLDRGDVDFSGITENYHNGLHVGSFVMSLSEKAFYHPKIIEYWRNFVPLSTRRYAIGRGELGFSKAMRKAGFVPNVKWTLSQLKIALLALPMSKTIEIFDNMEPHFKKNNPMALEVIDRHMEGFLGQNNEEKNENIFYSSEDLDHYALRAVRYRESFAKLPQELQTSIFEDEVKSSLVDYIVSYIFRGSNIHHGAAPLLYIGAGLLKKDVVLRRIVQPFDLHTLLERAVGKDNPDINEICIEILAKGHPYSLTGWAKVMNDWDFT